MTVSKKGIGFKLTSMNALASFLMRGGIKMELAMDVAMVSFVILLSSELAATNTKNSINSVNICYMSVRGSDKNKNLSV